MSLENLSEKAKWFAIGECLTRWGEDLKADDVFDAVLYQTEDKNGFALVDAWEPFERWSGQYLYDHMIDMATHFDRETR